MAINVTTSAQLRTAIQNVVSSDPLISVADANYTTITTLAKLPSYRPEPAAPFNGYTIDGASRASTIIEDTRIYQQNIDGPYGPNIVKDLTLNYTSPSLNTGAILRATTGTRTLDNLLITGQHSGWQGNGGVYMSLTVSDASNAINTSLILKNSTTAVSGQVGGSAFLQSWNNQGMVNLENNQFDEAGLNAGSFHFGTMYADLTTSSGQLGTYFISNNTFTRSSGSQTPRSRGNRLETVIADVQGNTFSKGAFLDLYGDVSGVKINNQGTPNVGNTFETVLGGSGIRLNQSTTSGVQLVTNNGMGSALEIVNNVFTGYGMAITNTSTVANSILSAGSNTVQVGTGTPLSAMVFNRLIAGGSGNNNISSTGATSKDWINAGLGNDTVNGNQGDDYIIGGAGVDSLTGGAGADTFLYYENTEGQDIITDFATASDCLAFRGNTSGGSTFFNFAPGSSLTLGTNFITSGAAATNAVPTFIYFGGVLSYDADGTGGGAAVNIATLTGSPTLAASDIKFF